MKKFISIIVTFCMLISIITIFPSTAFAASGTCGNNVRWSLDSAGILRISGSGDMTNWAHVYTQSPWYWDYKFDIKKVIIENGVTSIGDDAFYYCRKITSVTIPNSVTRIGDGAFENCDALTSVVIPNSVKTIGYGAFDDCDNLESVTIGNKVEHIRDWAFQSCDSLRKITIPNSVKTIGSLAFSDCDSLREVTIGSNVTFSGYDVFYDCNYLNTVEIKEGVTNLGHATFESCRNLNKVILPKTLIDIGTATFYGCGYVNVYYFGTEQQWNNITGVKSLQNVTLKTHFNYVGIPVSSISMFSLTTTMKMGDTKQLIANVLPQNATNKTLTWSTNNPLVATVNNNGVVTAKGVGKATITAKSNNGKKASCTVTVTSAENKNYDYYKYLFMNHADEFGYSNEKDETGKVIKINYKIPKERYLQLGYTEGRAKGSVKTWGGNCFGMSMSSILFYKNILKEENYHIQGLYYEKPSFPIELLFPDQNKKLREMIELLHISQNLNSAIAKPFSLTEVIEELSSDKPIILGMYEKGRKKGHAIVISGYSQNGSLYDLEFYDCGNYITSITCDVNSKITLTSTNDAPNWKLFEYYCYDDLCNIYLDILKNGKDSISLFSNNSTDSYTQIITPANDMSIVNSQGKKMTIQDGEICSDIDNIKLIPSSYLADEQTYTIILPTDTYTIVGSGNEVITTSFVDDYMSSSVTAKSSTTITISSDLREISVDTVADEEYDITYTTYDNIFDEMTLSGKATSTVTTKLNDADVLISGVNTLNASASVSDSVVSTNSDSLSNSDEITVKCEETDSGATIQILSVDTELTDKTSLPERLTVDTPAYDLVSGTYTEGQVLTFTKDDDTIIYYTTDGSIPSADNGIIYSLPIEINKSMTIKAVSTKYGYLDSEIVELNYTLPEVDMPQANIESDEYDKVITVELTTGDYEDTIYYTLDGSSPLENGILYTVPINISEDTYLQAYTLRNGCISEISEYEYTVTPAYPFYFSNSLTNQDGEIITPDNIADVTKVKLTLSKLHTGDHTGVFLIAFYDSDNRLIYVNSKSATINEDIDEVEMDITEDVSYACKVKAFALKDLSNIQSICKAMEENIIIE